MLLIGSLAAAAGCATSEPPPPAPLPGPADGAAYGARGFRLLIERPEDLSGSREVQMNTMEDLGGELVATLGRGELFEEISTDPEFPADLRLRPVVLLERVTQRKPNAVVELSLRFELRQARSNAVVWSREYSETSPTEIVFRSPFERRQLLLAGRAIRRRILESLRADLIKILLVY